MQSRNTYSYQIEKKLIKKIATTESPAHRRYFSEQHKAWYDLTNAVDFLCDAGTPILAACDGEVVAIVDGLTKNHNKREPPSRAVMPEEEQDGNYVVIKHSNEELTIHSHLQPGSIVVKKGSKVKTRDKLGLSGNTGWSLVPHLHFMVFKFTKKQARDFESLEIKFS